MDGDSPSEIDQIIEHLEDRLIPTELKTGSQSPAWYESEMSGRYESRMRKRARRLLQQISPERRRSVLAFFENEEEVRSLLEEIRERKKRLEEIGYEEESVESVNQVHDLLRSARSQIAGQSHAGLLEEHPSLSLFVGEETDATF